MQFSLPNAVKTIINTLESAGFEAWCVGGCVRDMLLGITPHDFDITTNALPNQIKDLFKKTVDTGIKHGTVTVIIENRPFEVTTFRSDGDYLDHRSPAKVNFLKTIDGDLARRDFTVNAMAYHESRGLLDLFGGEADLKAGILKAVGEPEKRFSEDALRILRLFRFAARLDFTIEKNTLDAAIKCAKDLSLVSRERICFELIETLVSKKPDKLNHLLKSDALSFLGVGKGDISSLSMLKQKKSLRFLAFCLATQTDPLRLCNELKTDNALKRHCESFLEGFTLPNDTPYDLKKLLYLCGEDATRDILTLNKKEHTLLDNILISGEPIFLNDLKVDGNILNGYNIKGPIVGDTLRKMLEYVWINPEANTKDTLINLFLN